MRRLDFPAWWVVDLWWVRPASNPCAICYLRGRGVTWGGGGVGLGGAALRVARVGLRPPSPRRSAGRRVYLYARPLRRHAFLSDHDNLCRVSVSRSAASFCISSLIFSMSCLVSARGPIVPGSRSNGSDSDIGGDGASVGGSIADVICSRLDIGRTSTATGTARDSREHIQVPIRSVLFCDKHGFRQSE